MKTLLKSIATILLVFQFILANSQTFTKDQKEIIETNVNELINNYTLYSTFTQDNNTLSTLYFNNFSSLFKENSSVYNDLLLKNDKHELVCVSDYCDLVRALYLSGLGVTISEITKRNATSKKNFYEMIVEAKKSITAFNESEGKLLNKEYQIQFKIEFDKDLYTFLISSVNNSDYQDLPICQPPQPEFAIKIIDESGSIIRDAEVSIEYDGKVQQVKKSNPNGDVTFSNVPGGTEIYITATKGSLLGYFNGTINDLKELKKKIVLKKETLCSFIVEIRNLDNNPIPKAQVKLMYEGISFSKEQIADQKGVVKFNDVPCNKNVTITALADNYDENTISGTSEKFMKSKINVLKLPPISSIDLLCTVINSQSQRYISDIEVSIDINGKIIREYSDLKGKVTFPRIPKRSYIKISTTDQFGYEDYTKTIESFNENEEITIELIPVKLFNYLSFHLKSIRSSFKNDDLFSLANNENINIVSLTGQIIDIKSKGINVNFFHNFIQKRYFETGIGVGIGLSNYKSELKITSIECNYNEFDTVSQLDYSRIISGNSINESLSLTYFDVPISLQLKINPQIRFVSSINFDFGIKYSVLVLNKCETKSGILSYSGLYSYHSSVIDFEYPIENTYNNEMIINDYGFAEDIPTPTKSNFAKTNDNMFYFINAGISFPVSEKLFFDISGNYSWSSKSINNNGNFIYKGVSNDILSNYNSLYNKSDKTKIKATSIEIGLTYKFN